ncbi:MAG: hypothetical protein IJI44_08030 [Erysipelotrichaceae bacterium]|nr:hypothetical protein [Erysipelotrichaceae bacterium]
MEIRWIGNYEIYVRIDRNTAVISANRDGLLSLARQLIDMADEVPGTHIHYDDSNSLEEGSSELIIEKTE